MLMALSSPREDHRSEASRARSVSSVMLPSSPTTASKTCWPVAPPSCHDAKRSCVDWEKLPICSSMRPSTSDVWNSLRKSFTLSNEYAPLSAPACRMEKYSLAEKPICANRGPYSARLSPSSSE